jgi:catechol 2,3-dioxygenase-like lactoylglutathione lyase family enzyme
MIAAFQHVGMGVRDVERTYDFYRDLMGFRVELSDETEYQVDMTPIVGDLVEMRVMMAVNIAGGAAIELVEHTSTKPMEAEEPLQWGDIGYLELGLKVHQLDDVYLDLKRKGVEFITPVLSMELSSGGTERYAYIRDPDGLLIQLVEVPNRKRAFAVGGARHVAIGVSDMGKARDFYGEVLGFTDLIHRFEGRIPELDDVTGGREMEMVILGHQGGQKSVLPLLERAIVKLVHTPGYRGRPTFEGRRWGDIGLMEMAFDVTDLAESTNGLLSKGAELLHPPTRVDMGQGTIGAFSYIKDPDGTILEQVEVEKVMWVSPKVMKYFLVWLLKAAAKVGII